MTYDEAINYLESLNTFGIKPGLERITRMLDALGNPQSKYKTIHVTGTNGKGSVCAMLSEMLSTAGIKVGLFTSPHLNSYRERFKINNRNINEKIFVANIDKIVDIIDNIMVDGEDHPTQFEALTAMAFEYFAEEGVEYAVIEVGLGGTLDSTNVINPAVTAITNVGMDHADKCGGTLEGIAHHKAGIIKRGVPVVTAARGEPLRIIKETAAKLNAPLHVINEENFVPPARPLKADAFDHPLKADAFDHPLKADAFDHPLNVAPSEPTLKISLEGDYQRENAAVAIAVAQTLNDPRLTPSVLRYALEHVTWAGRFEIFNVNGQTVVIDGAHNPDGAGALRRSLDIRFQNRPRRFLFGVLGDKDYNSMLDILFQPSDTVVVTRPQSSRAAAPKLIAELLNRRNIRADAVEDIKAAFNVWLNGDEQTISIAAGSLYMIGVVRELIVGL